MKHLVIYLKLQYMIISCLFFMCFHLKSQMIIKKRKELADAMGHSVDTQTTYIKQ